MTIRAKQVQRKSSGETMQVRVSFAQLLVDSDTLTGTPTVAEQTTSDLTITSVEVNTGVVTILGESVSASNAVLFMVAAGSVGVSYIIKVTVSTVGGSIFEREIVLNVQ
tara:strand:+ start:1180 stop:1506 length:327 start_codon:yes stop_codon:yes gene_type:complete